MEKIRKILLVDDEVKVINALKRIFDIDKYEVLFTTNPEDAISLLDNDIDIIICDHNMPNMSGIEVLRYARKISPNTIRILITGYSDLDIAIDAINEGNIYHFFSKPWKYQEVISVVEKAIKDKQDLDKKSLLYKALNDNNERLLELTRSLKSGQAKKTRKLPVREGENIILIEAIEILYLTMIDGSVNVITEAGQYKSPESLTWWEKNLDDGNFFRSHRSYIINIDKIEKIVPWFNGAYNINLKNLKENIPLSRGAIKELKLLLGF